MNRRFDDARPLTSRIVRLLLLLLLAPAGASGGPAGEPPREDDAPEAALTVSGRVLDEDGAPIAGAEVWLLDTPWRPPDSGVPTAEDGSFRVTGLGPGTWRVEVAAEGRYQLDPHARIQLAESLSGLEVRMVRGAVISGRVLGFDPADADDLQVVVAPRGPGGPWIDGEVDADGGYRVAGVPPGAWRVQVRLGRQGASYTNVPIDLAAGEREARLDVELRGPLTLGGRATLGGEPLADLVVMLIGYDAAPSAQTRTGPDGGFRITRLPTGRYGLMLVSLDPPLSHHREIELDADRQVAIDLAAHAVVGRVVDAETGAPLGGALLRLVPKGTGGSEKGGVPSAESDGGFRVPRVPPGDYLLYAERSGYAPELRELTVGAEGDLETVEVALSPAFEAILEVASTTGMPLRHVGVTLLDPAAADPPADASSIPGVLGDRSGRSEHGRVHLGGVPAGRWLALVSAPWMAVAAVEVAVPGPPTGVLLSPQATVELIVPGLDVPAPVRILGPDGRPLLFPHGEVARTSWGTGAGGGRLDHVPAGTWTIEVVDRDGRAWSGRVTAVEGEVAEVVLEERSAEEP